MGMESSSVPYEREIDEGEQGCTEHVVKGCGATLACDPLRKLHRYLMLFFICFLSFGNYFCYDSPAALQDVMIRDLNLTETQFMNLYAWYSWPNVVLSFVGGFLIDRVFGISLGAIIFSLCVLIGQILTGIGALLNSLYFMYFARFVLGIGGESLSVAQNTYTTEWFSSSELTFVFGLQFSVAHAGPTVSVNTMQLLYKSVGERFGITGHRRLGVALLIAVATCAFSTSCALILAYFTRRAKRIRTAHEFKAKSNDLIDPSPTTAPVARISLLDVFHFPVAVWFICIICVTYYVTVFPFVSLGLVFFERKFYLSVQDAAVVNSMVYIVSAVASPLFGAAIDFTGCNIHWLLSGVLITLLCHLTFAFASHTLPPLIIMIILGLAYSILASSLWPMVAYLLPVHKRGTAYGLIQSVQNLGLGVVAIFAGYLVDNKGYLFLEVFFTISLGFCLITIFVLYGWNAKHGDVLNETGAHRRAKQYIIIEPLLETHLPDTGSHCSS